jgi:hypothetical protein
MAEGTGVRVENCDQHVDPVAEAVRYQIAEAELVQSVGRGRGVNRTAETPLDIDIVSDVVVPITVNEVVHWETPSEAIEMPARDGIVLTAPADMARAWPDVWKNAEAARYAQRKLGAEIRPGGVPIEHAVKSLYRIFLIGKLPHALSHAATILYRRAVNGAQLAVAFFDPRQLPNPAAWLREKQGELAERLHYLWQPHEIPPLGGAGKVEIIDRLVQILRKARYTLSADWKQHKIYAGAGRRGRYTLSKDAMTAYDGAPGGITTPHCLIAAVTPKLPPWSTPVVEEITDPVLVRQIHAECASAEERTARSPHGVKMVWYEAGSATRRQMISRNSF